MWKVPRNLQRRGRRPHFSSMGRRPPAARRPLTRPRRSLGDAAGVQYHRVIRRRPCRRRPCSSEVRSRAPRRGLIGRFNQPRSAGWDQAGCRRRRTRHRAPIYWATATPFPATRRSKPRDVWLDLLAISFAATLDRWFLRHRRWRSDAPAVLLYRRPIIARVASQCRHLEPGGKPCATRRPRSSTPPRIRLTVSVSHGRITKDLGRITGTRPVLATWSALLVRHGEPAGQDIDTRSGVTRPGSAR